MIKLILMLIFCLVVSANSSPKSAITVGGELKYEFITNKLEKGWSTSNVGLNKNFHYSQPVSTTTTPDWLNSAGTILLLKLAVFPAANFSANADLEIINNYADRLWMPVNDEHRLYQENKSVRWVKGEAKYLQENWYLKYFKGVGHYHWGDEGDMFNLYPEQYETERYLRVSGRAVPEGFEGYCNTGRWGNLTVIAGPELVWGYRDAIYTKYNFKISRFDNTIIYKNEIIPYGEPNERLSATQLSTKFNLSRNFFLQIGLLYQPFRLGWNYQYTEENSTTLKNDTIQQKDAIATKLKLTTNPYPVLNELSLEYGYSGLVAGNKTEISVKANRTLTKYLTGALEYTYRQPLLGPLPFIYEGTEDTPGAVLINPRGPESPFWVNWSNRQASLLSFIFTFDPTPATWFYKYQPNKLEEWNLNPDEDAAVAFSLKYSLEYYPTTTDRMFYYDESGNVVWEPYYHSGAWATKDYLNTLSLIGKLKLPGYRILLSFSSGESLAGSSLAYTELTSREKPLTRFLQSSVSLVSGPWSGKILYGQNVWGPEEWQRTFGETIDRLYQLSIARTFGDTFKLSADYTSTRETDNKYYAPEIGSYDEIRIMGILKFDATFSLGG